MKKLAISALVALSLAACGSAHPTAAQKAQGKQDTVKAEQIVKGCLPQKNGAPDPLLLRSKSVRKTFVNCAVPQSKRAQFSRCITSGLLGGFPTKSRIENVVTTCVGKVA